MAGEVVLFLGGFLHQPLGDLGIVGNVAIFASLCSDCPVGRVQGGIPSRHQMAACAEGGAGVVHDEEIAVRVNVRIVTGGALDVLIRVEPQLARYQGGG